MIILLNVARCQEEEEEDPKPPSKSPPGRLTFRAGFALSVALSVSLWLTGTFVYFYHCLFTFVYVYLGLNVNLFTFCRPLPLNFCHRARHRMPLVLHQQLGRQFHKNVYLIQWKQLEKLPFELEENYLING